MSHFVDITRATIEVLKSASDLVAAGKEDEAGTKLAGLTGNVKELTDASTALHQIASTEEEAVQQNLHAVLQKIADVTAAEADLRRRTETTIAAQQADSHQLDELEKQLAAYNSEISQLSSRLDDLNHQLSDNRDKMSKWFWVPGYNVYLAARNIQDLIQGTQGSINSARDSLRDIQSRMSPLQQDKQRIDADLATLKAQIAIDASTASTLKAQETALEASQAALSRTVAWTSSVALFYETLSIKLADLKTALDDTFQISTALAAPVDVIDPQGNVTSGTMEAALNLLAEHAEAASTIIYPFQNIDSQTIQ